MGVEHAIHAKTAYSVSMPKKLFSEGERLDGGGFVLGYLEAVFRGVRVFGLLRPCFSDFVVDGLDVLIVFLLGECFPIADEREGMEVGVMSCPLGSEAWRRRRFVSV